MKINGVDFNDTWVAKFKTAEDFAESPSNQHLYPELKKVEDRKEQLKAVWNLIVKPVQAISHDSNSNDDKPQNARRSRATKRSVSGNPTADGAAIEGAVGERGGHEPEADNLAGENGVPTIDSAEEGEKQPD